MDGPTLIIEKLPLLKKTITIKGEGIRILAYNKIIWILKIFLCVLKLCNECCTKKYVDNFHVWGKGSMTCTSAAHSYFIYLVISPVGLASTHTNRDKYSSKWRLVY